MGRPAVAKSGRRTETRPKCMLSRFFVILLRFNLIGFAALFEMTPLGDPRDPQQWFVRHAICAITTNRPCVRFTSRPSQGGDWIVASIHDGISLDVSSRVLVTRLGPPQ
ncbi:hypothetical protein BO82DRAFT_57229 [Aspergillus uvarum CBS 121591]|uniref:Uncharacterized protein n=1 Tax=Aspergillus uvarum CBS 121591 TaxID=1448315 RepID=A0A319CEW4_9EURO|nr:hypothetical protein BO82DRAFT_57229 [Aspergillus uvarum CBS 121591]PYH82809.1 hypothetical protein BO82DRAFT_57229 [Aspergillus uvarum CBS 121591]